ncbi:MAG TPA: nuclear transport factor 2 family protein [Ktedonobacteraceae bacterium]|nr:nuclear transport factor 2 family protein [Ktedonobacteraceae bacterium]
MNALDTVRTFMLALEARDFAKASTYLAEDFIFSGWTPQPLDREQFITVMSGLKAGIPNLTYHFHTEHKGRDLLELDTQVRGAVQITGNQTDSFILPPLGLPPIPQMARAVSLPEEHWNYTVQKDQIAQISVERVAGGGIQGLLQQLGIDAPIIQ